MSQIVWTELEAEPLRWPYGQARPAAPRVSLSGSEKSFNESTTPSAQTQHDVHNGGRAVYGDNLSAQHIVNTSTGLWKISEVQLYMKKNGSPPNDLVVEIYDASTDTSIYEPFMGQRQTQLKWNLPYKIYGSNVYGDQFSITSFLSANLKKIQLEIEKTGNPGDLILEFRDFDTLNNKPGSTTLSTVTVQGSSIPAGDSAVEIDAPSLPASTISIVLKAPGGDANNYYGLKWGSDNNVAWTSSDGGATWTSGPDTNAAVRIWFLTEARRPAALLTSGSIPPANVSTTAGYHSITLTNPILIPPNKEVFMLIKTIGGDASNNYAVYLERGFTGDGGGYLYQGGYALYSVDGGASWSPDVGSDGYGATEIGRLGDLRFKLMGLRFSRIYSGTLSNTSSIAAARARHVLRVEAKANTGTIEIAGVIEDKANSASTTSTSYVELEIFSEYNDIPQGNVSYWIYANGDGYARNPTAQRYAYFDKNPLYPRDLGFSELYMTKATAIDPDSLAIINDNEAGALYFTTPGETYTTPSNLRAPIKKIEILTGRVTIDLLGIK